MFAFLKTPIIYLLCLVFQSGCNSCRTNKSRTISVKEPQQIIGKLSDVASYEKTLATDLKDKILSILEDSLFYKRFLEKIAADPKMQPKQLSPDQQEEWHKVYLLFVDLYRIIYQTLELVKIKYDSNRKPEEALMGDLSDESLDLMELMFIERGNGCFRDQNLNITYEKLLATTRKHYSTPFKRYIDGGKWGTFEESVNKGRLEIYQAVTDLLKEVFEESESKKET